MALNDVVDDLVFELTSIAEIEILYLGNYREDTYVVLGFKF